ncbi:MAG: glycerate kinase [Mycobacteriaceae bacterium]
MNRFTLRRILVAPSGFKESLYAEEVAEAITTGIRRVLPDAEVDAIPVPDGGEGTARTLATATNGHLIPVSVTGPVGKTITSHYAVLGGDASKTAVVEMAAAAGLSLVPRDSRNPCVTTTYGVGQLIAAAIDGGATRVIVGCGDSGTCDGGAGALQALGARILDAAGADLPPGGLNLQRAASLDLSGLHPGLAGVEIVLACNAKNVLCGDKGVARVFARQKGASDEEIELLSDALENWANVLERDGRPVDDIRTGLGTGASGGLGAGLAAGVGAKLVSRFDVFLDSGLYSIDLDAQIAKADLVITAEGSIDFQTPNGKVPAEVARRAVRVGVPVIALAGSIGQGAAAVHDVGIDAITSIMDVPMPLADAVAHSQRLLIEATEQMMRMILVGLAISERRSGEDT